MSEDGNSAEGAAEAARKLAEPAPRTFSEFLESVSPAAGKGHKFMGLGAGTRQCTF
jgi:hypothetical protein